MREERTKNGVNYKVNYIYAGGEAIGFTLRGQWKIDLDGAKAQDFPFYYVKDAQGNVRKIVDRMGNCVVKYNYNAWGKETVTPVESTWEFPLELNSDGTVKKFCQASDIAELNRLTYRGYFYNRELGLYYLINRYYDPETGRFIFADDAEYLDFQTLYGSNRYIYCLNNPVNYIDPDGTMGIMATLIIATIVGAIIGATIETGKQVLSTGWDNIDVGAIVEKALLGAATGFAFAAGGIAGGIVKGTMTALSIASKTLTVVQSVTLLTGMVATTGFAAGSIGYVAKQSIDNQEISPLKAFSRGFGQMGKNLSTFIVGAFMGASGTYQIKEQGVQKVLYMMCRTVAKAAICFVPNCLFDSM